MLRRRGEIFSLLSSTTTSVSSVFLSNQSSSHPSQHVIVLGRRNDHRKVIGCTNRDFSSLISSTLSAAVHPLNKTRSAGRPLLLSASKNSRFDRYIFGRHQNNDTSLRQQHLEGKHQYSTHSHHPNLLRFGLVLDIDGVICRGKYVLPGVRECFRDYLTDETTGKFNVPTVFVTNAGNTKRTEKAEQLTQKIGIPIDEDQVIMSHSPLKMFTQFHDQHVLVVGQDPVYEIAKVLGFTRITTIDDLRTCFPGYDCVDHKRRMPDPSTFDKYFPEIDAVILFGEPVRWETSLQYLVDVLLTNGRMVPEDTRSPLVSSPSAAAPKKAVVPHIPVLACNIDLLWAADTAPLPRFAHGSFLLCLEALYKKLSGGRELRYSALMGKPSELTYHHAEYCIQKEARKIGIPCPHTIYAIGDNPESDILGANIFQQYLNHRNIQKSIKLHRELKAQEEELEEQQKQIVRAAAEIGGRFPSMSYDRSSIDGSAKYMLDYGVERCHSVLVETGVYSAKDQMQGVVSNFHLTELAKNTLLKTPSFSEPDLMNAVQMIFQRENYIESRKKYD